MWIMNIVVGILKLNDGYITWLQPEQVIPRTIYKRLNYVIM